MSGDPDDLDLWDRLNEDNDKLRALLVRAESALRWARTFSRRFDHLPHCERVENLLRRPPEYGHICTCGYEDHPEALDTVLAAISEVLEGAGRPGVRGPAKDQVCESLNAAPAPVSEFNEQAADLVWGEGGRHPLPGSEEALMQIAALQGAAPVSEAAPERMTGVIAQPLDLPDSGSSTLFSGAHPVEHAEGLPPGKTMPCWMYDNWDDLQRLAEMAVRETMDAIRRDAKTGGDERYDLIAARVLAAWRAQRGGK